MVILRGCSKCEGDVYPEENIDGTDLVCLQCGYRQIGQDPVRLESRPLQEGRVRRVRLAS